MWTERALGELLSVVIDHRGKTPKKLGGTDFADSGVRVVSAVHIKGGRIQWSERERYVPQWMFEKWMPVRLRKDDVLLTSEAPLGEVAQVPSDDDLVLSQRLFALRGADKVLDSSYLRYFLESPDGQARLAARASGTTVLGIRQAELLRVPVPLPSYEAQLAIASRLRAIDDLIDTDRLLIQQVEALVGAEFARYGFDALPEDESVALGDLVSVNPTEPKPSGAASYVDMASLPTDGSCITRVARRPAASGARFRNGDALLARLTPCLENGKAAFVDVLDPDEVAVGSTEFLVLRGQQAVGTHWPYVLSRSARFREYAIRHMNGSSGRQRCSAETVERYPIRPPNDDDLTAFAAFATPMFQTVRALADEAQALQSARDELLPLLVSGTVEVRELDEVVTQWSA